MNSSTENSVEATVNKSTLRRNFYILLALSFLACVCLGWYAYHQTEQLGIVNNQVSALTDTVTIYKNKAGQNGAYVPIFSGSKAAVIAAVKNVDPRIAAAIKATPGIRSFTEVKTITKTDTIVRIDTLRLPAANQPLFLVKEINDPFYKEKVTVNGDSLRVERQNFESFDFVTRDKSNGFLKPKSYVTDIVAKNPDTKIIGLKSYEITPKSKTGLKISIGIAAGIAAALLLK